MRVGAKERAEARGDAFPCACLFRRDDPTDIGSWPRLIDECAFHAARRRETEAKERLEQQLFDVKGWLYAWEDTLRDDAESALREILTLTEKD